MNYRLWYPQLDANDTIRRMALILGHAMHTVATKERLFICDFYLANPPLLHKTRMPIEIRQEFNKLSIKKPDKAFLNYPPSPILYAKMAGTQQQALHNFIGRRFVDFDSLRHGEIRLSQAGVFFSKKIIRQSSVESESELLRFICTDFIRVGLDQPGGLYNATGLRRVGN